MLRWLLIVLFLPHNGSAQRFSAADLRQLKTYSTGFFSNEAQVKADSQTMGAVLTVQPIWQKRKDGIWLFAEKRDTGQHYQVWHYYLQDDTTLVMQLLDFKDVQKAVQLSSDIKQETNLFLHSLRSRPGCEIYLAKNKTGYEGRTSGKECFAGAAGTEYLAYEVVFAKNTIGWQEKVFDKDDKELPEAGKRYSFLKQVKPSK